MNLKIDNRKEAKLMASVDHKYCMQLRALCIAEPIMIVTQLIRYGSVVAFMQKHRDKCNERMLLVWAQQIAEGMDYLESRKIVHRDLAARNILVKELYHIKITDFGLARIIESDEHAFRAINSSLVPIKWLAIESIMHRLFTPKSDVWSYGVCLWEIFTFCAKPYAEIGDAAELVLRIAKGVRLAQPQMVGIDIYLVLIKCWMESADARPTFKELGDEFARMSESANNYLDFKVTIL